MTVYKIIEEPLRIHRVFNNKKERAERVAELMDIVGLDRRYVDTYPHELDGGRRQRIGVARPWRSIPNLLSVMSRFRLWTSPFRLRSLT